MKYDALVIRVQAIVAQFNRGERSTEEAGLAIIAAVKQHELEEENLRRLRDGKEVDES